MNKETILTSAFRVHRSKFSCSLAATLLGTRRVPGRRVCLGRLRVGGWNNRQGWAGEKVAFLSILYRVLPLFEMCRSLNFHGPTIVLPQTPSFVIFHSIVLTVLIRQC
jgi:hypothetical protein